MTSLVVKISKSLVSTKLHFLFLCKLLYIICLFLKAAFWVLFAVINKYLFFNTGDTTWPFMFQISFVHPRVNKNYLRNVKINLFMKFKDNF